MPDREKVIEGLEVCLAADLSEGENPCAPCPYFFDGMCQNTMKKDALALLREQEPVKWIRISPAGLYECSGCGQNVMTGDIKAYKYCHGCGRKVNWTEEEGPKDAE